MNTQLDKTSNIGIEYTKTRDRSRGRMSAYHRKPNPMFLGETRYEHDIKNISEKKRKDVLIFNKSWHGCDLVDVAKSRFTIGFEIEKNYFSRGAVKEYELFCGFETDSSCGYEAVTHVLPLVPPSIWRTKVFDMMLKAEKIIDNQYSPSDSRCGGHINIGVNGESGKDILKAIRPYMGIVYALFRYRLKTNYCMYNPRLLASHELTGYHDNIVYRWHNKYRVALCKSNVLELRIPTRVENVKQLMRRYELMYEIVDTAYNKPRTTLSKLLRNVKPILMRMYDRDEAKVDEIIVLAHHFQNYINKGKIFPTIEPFLPQQTIV